jgi:PKD repeat protein
MRGTTCQTWFRAGLFLLVVASWACPGGTRQNHAPVASPGGPYSGTVGVTVSFNGSASSDSDGDSLTFAWDYGDGITGTGATPTHAYASAGTFTVTLTVSDGRGGTNSATTHALISPAPNHPPVAVTGGPYTGTAGVALTFDGTGSSDPDGDTLSFSWDFGDGNSGTGSSPSHTYAAAGTFTVTLTVTDPHTASDSSTAQATILPPANQLPVAVSGGPYSGTAGIAVAFDGSASSDPDGDTLSFSWNFGDGANGTGARPSHTYAAPGTFTVTLTVDDGRGGTNSAGTQATISPAANGPPVAVAGGPYSGMAGIAVAFDGSGSSDPEGDPLSFSWDFGDGETGTGARPRHVYAAAGSFNVQLAVKDGHGGVGNASSTAAIAPIAIPPDPVTVAPQNPVNVVTSVNASTAFLYTGPNPIQTGVAPGTIEVRRAAVVRGKVTDTSGASLSGVTVSVLDHPELGQTLSRDDGMFDLAVNGGGSITLHYRKSGYPAAQRTLQVPWQDFTRAPDVALVPYDPNANAVILSGALQVARGSRVTDGDGTRQATLLVPAGASATMTLEDGSTESLSAFHVRLTEYTVGASGQQAMPADLPATSGYTYEAEYSIDEAEAAGATRVSFNPPLVSYTENFLGFPVGGVVPSGDYDRRAGRWIPLPNGVVVEVLDIVGGQALLDVDGSGQPASADALAALGITTAELQAVASLYPKGQTLWRAPIDRFLGLR